MIPLNTLSTFYATFMSQMLKKIQNIKKGATKKVSRQEIDKTRNRQDKK